MGVIMYDFISKSREDRKIEMDEYITKGYDIAHKSRYYLTDRMQIDYYGEKPEVGVRINADEPYFIFINKGANINLSLYDIYRILANAQRENIPSLDLLCGQLEISDQSGSFTYKGRSYSMMKPVHVNDDECKYVLPDSGIEIPGAYLFVIIALIQTKSNALFNRSSDNNKRLMNGFLRMLICLLKANQDYPALRKRGWRLKPDGKEFVFRKEDADEQYRTRKYYLTQEEYNYIINT